jgi:hypothetical protein
MKRIIILIIFVSGYLSLYSQAPPPPPGDPTSGGTNGPVGGSAPLDGGLSVLVALGVVYAAKKVVANRMV